MNKNFNPWLVQVQGRMSDLENLACHFASTPFRVSKDERDGGFIYESDSFSDCLEPKEVLILARIAAMNTMTYLGMPKFIRVGVILS
ncbi:MAG: hypothetical protein NTZ45_00390 [Methylococcales bacterium]|nr:hypothetical protein [Methylococcales bacterium]